MKASTLFSTENLIVRHWISEDLPAILKVYGDPDAMKWVGDGSVLTQTQAEKWLAVTARNYEKRGYGMFTILEKKSEQIIGFGGLVHPGEQVEVEVKYAYLRDFWGRGFASEFIQALLKYAKSKLSITNIIATTHPENEASKKVLTKSGFVLEKEVLNDDGTFTSLFRWTSE
ncbi:GNAT family N-acetyltransferase [Bdellovibrio sp. ArHS]|uniref:GNAT family N-acetyltransferase n=1 Tax=Bdellovibrio sp. ArHS TaxID=1569284 RepID=UPI000B05D4D7|nr:GNAT family N-acetyltransferase [Bdellovibrio sp. ArHS]